ncbi:MAG TPA: T9SS type A sorting domain-containing protein, partial [Bacteroidetes bacterium]|nr:T9SS type A sorting domain-containing protein [Bacteroidota bacterium]HEX03664.1 T9SS type A sorting domain-containing protein [Bacteroidota bacterium]
LFTLNWDMLAGPSDTLMIAGANQRHQLFISEDCGWSWYEQPIELPGDYHGETCWQLKYDKWRDRLWIDTGYGLAYKDNPTLSVGEEVWTFIPADYVTLDAYPNPFNISSTIRYSLQRPAEIKLDVFDVLGRQVATLAEGLVEPGEHRATFDASQLASGVYFVQLNTGSETIRHKIVLTK